MTLSALTLIMVRRWYIAAIGSMLTGALAVGAFHFVKPDYNAAGSILLLPPANPGANPYLDLAALPGVPEVISRVLQDSQYSDRYEDVGIKDYEVSPDQGAGGPAVLVIGKGHSDDEALAAMRTVMADVLPVLQDLQDDAGVERPNRITGRQIYVETEATKLNKKQTLAVIAAVGLGLGLTLVLVVAFDALLGRLAARRRRKRPWLLRDGSGTGEIGPSTDAAVKPARARDSEPVDEPESEPVDESEPADEPRRTRGGPAPAATVVAQPAWTSQPSSTGRSTTRSTQRPATHPSQQSQRPQNRPQVRSNPGGTGRANSSD